MLLEVRILPLRVVATGKGAWEMFLGANDLFLHLGGACLIGMCSLCDDFMPVSFVYSFIRGLE